MFDLFLFARFAVRAYLIRMRARRQQPAGLEALFTEPEQADCPIPLPNCETCRPEPADHRELGRGAELTKSSISEVAAWLETEGWAGEDAGRLQVVAAWLIKRREAYERGLEVPS